MPPAACARAPQRPAAVAGGAPTLEEIYRTHALTVVRWASRLGGPAVDLDDVLHDVFLVVQRQLPGFRGESKLTTWLFGITRNVVRGRRERERMRRFFMASLAPLLPPPGSDAPQVERLERQQSLDLVYRVLDDLPERYRTPFVLFELEGMSGDEAAELTGVKVSTLRVNLMRARARFTERLERLLRRREAGR